MRLTLTSVALFLVCCPLARAGSVQAGKDGVVPYVSFTAAPGEANDLTIRLRGDGSGAIVVHDAGAAITAATGCAVVDAHEVDCPGSSGPAATSVSAALGDGDDSAAVAPELGGRLEGGAGNDRLTACIVEGAAGDDVISGCDGFPGTNHELDGGAGDDTLSGGQQNDRLDGGPGHDILRGGGGNDTLSAQGAGALDAFDGGDGQDGLYLYGDADVRVDLVAGTARYGAAPAGSLLSIESVTTGGGNDVLIGDAGPNQLSSSGGEDSVDGGSGDDEISGGSGADVIHGGAGDDAINSFDLYRDSIDCGDGADRVIGDKADAKTGCEALSAPTYNLFGARLRVHRGTVSGSWACSKGLISVEGVFDSCAARVTLRLRARGQTFVAGSVSCPRVNCSWTLRLNRRARSLLETRSLHGTVELQPIPAHLALPTRERVMVIRGR